MVMWWTKRHLKYSASVQTWLHSFLLKFITLNKNECSKLWKTYLHALSFQYFIWLRQSQLFTHFRKRPLVHHQHYALFLNWYLVCHIAINLSYLCLNDNGGLRQTGAGGRARTSDATTAEIQEELHCLTDQSVKTFRTVSKWDPSLIFDRILGMCVEKEIICNKNSHNEKHLREYKLCEGNPWDDNTHRFLQIASF